MLRTPASPLMHDVWQIDDTVVACLHATFHVRKSNYVTAFRSQTSKSVARYLAAGTAATQA